MGAALRGPALPPSGVHPSVISAEETKAVGWQVPLWPEPEAGRTGRSAGARTVTRCPRPGEPSSGTEPSTSGWAGGLRARSARCLASHLPLVGANELHRETKHAVPTVHAKRPRGMTACLCSARCAGASQVTPYVAQMLSSWQTGPLLPRSGSCCWGRSGWVALAESLFCAASLAY